MPRKTPKRRKADKTPVTQDAQRRGLTQARPAREDQRVLQSRRITQRPPRFPGRLGGR